MQIGKEGNSQFVIRGILSGFFALSDVSEFKSICFDEKDIY